MFIDKNSLQVKIAGGNYVNLGNYIVEAKYGYNKIWGKDSGRVLSGNQTGTLLGIFPKIIVQFRKLTKSEVETLSPILDNARQTVKYYDPNKQAYVEMETYTGDWEITNTSIIDLNHNNNGFPISFISTKRRV